MMSSQTKISEEAKSSISEYIHSLEKLEILLLLSASPEKLWTVSNVYKYIQSSEISVAKELEELRMQGFLSADKMPGLVYRFSPQSENLRKVTEILALAYREQRIKVIELIFGQSEDELRRFSDAFKIRRDK